MTTKAMIMNTGSTICKVDVLHRDGEGRFERKMDPVELKPSEVASFYMYDGVMATVHGGYAVVTIAAYEGNHDFKVETQSRGEDGKFQAELNHDVVLNGRCRVFSVSDGHQLQIHEQRG